MVGEVKKSIFEYDNYRTYLKDTYAYQKSLNKKFSFRFFARVAGFSSHNFLKAVMDGKSNLSVESIPKFAKALKLNKEETFFFRNLVLFNQAKSSDEKQRFAQEILRSRSYRKMHPLLEAQFSFYGHWYYTPIRELPTLPDFKEDPEWIAKKLCPAITATEAKKALDTLMKLGLLARDENGRIVQSNPHITTSDEVSSSYVTAYHKQFLQRAADSIDLVSRENREISAITLGITKETATQIKGMIQQFRKDIMKVASQDQIPEIIYQLNFQLFPLVQEGEKK